MVQFSSFFISYLIRAGFARIVLETILLPIHNQGIDSRNLSNDALANHKKSHIMTARFGGILTPLVVTPTVIDQRLQMIMFDREFVLLTSLLRWYFKVL